MCVRANVMGAMKRCVRGVRRRRRCIVFVRGVWALGRRVEGGGGREGGG